MRTIIEKVAERIDGFTDQYIGITHADDHDTAYELEQMIRKTFSKSRIIVHPIGSVIGVHIGIGGVGIFFLIKDLGTIII